MEGVCYLPGDLLFYTLDIIESEDRGRKRKFIEGKSGVGVA